MAEAILEQMHKDLKIIKKDIAVIKHILSEEGELTEEERKMVAKAIEEEKQGKTVSLVEAKKRLGL